MSDDSLDRLRGLAAADDHLMALLMSASTPAEVVRIAGEHGV